MPSSIEILSKQEAQKLVLLSQGIPPSKKANNDSASTLSVIEHLGYIQIDTISAVQRAHHHTLWNRNPFYKTEDIDLLIAEKQVFEYWSHAAAYLPMCDFRFSLPRKNAIASGIEKHWYDRNEKLMQLILSRIRTEGPLMAKDFENSGNKTGEWKSKPAKQALDTLFMQGDLMISSRNNFHKVYDLTERVLPENIDTSLPSSDEHARFLINRFLQANGIGQAQEVAYLLKNTKALVSITLENMLENSELIQIQLNDTLYFALPNVLELLNKALSKSKAKILSPFDNLLIQRKRMQNIFDFNYILECYLPASKRQYGYFSLPVLWDGKLIARMDCKAERKNSILHILHLALEPKLKKLDSFSLALAKELKSFMEFNNCNKIVLQQCSSDKFKGILHKELKNQTILD